MMRDYLEYLTDIPSAQLQPSQSGRKAKISENKRYMDTAGQLMAKVCAYLSKPDPQIEA